MSSTPPDPTPDDGAARRGLPVAVVVVAGVLAVQALALGWLAVDALTHVGAGGLGVGAQVFLVVIYVLLAAWVAAVAWGMAAGRAFSRGATVAIELFGVLLSTWLLSSGAPVAGAALLVLSGAALVAVFTGAVTAHLRGGRAPEGGPVGR